MNFLWAILGLIGAIVLYLILTGESATTFGLPNNQFAAAAAMSLWAALIAAAVIPRKGEFKQFARNAAIWIGIILVLTAGYVFRYDFQDIGSRMTAGLIPGSPRTVHSLEGRERVVLSKADGEHFLARMKVNDVNLTMLVDTGATSILLTERDAASVGIDVGQLQYNIPTSTANGLAYAARARIDTLQLGPIERRNMSVLVSKNSALSENLLGMSFLGSLSSFEFRGDELYLTD
ncbi:MAG: TIGR02281 family clan AA aspartic protease [Rhizobiaceae bacterium]